MRTDVADSGTRDILNVLFKHQRKIIATFLLIVLAVTAFSLSATPKYESKASLLIKVGREYVYRPEIGDERPPVLLDREDLINSEIEILTSRDLAATVVETIGIERLYPGIDQPPPLLSLATIRRAVNAVAALFHDRETEPAGPLELATFAFTGSLKVEAVAKSNVVRISFRHPDPELAAQSVSTLLDAFKAKRLSVFSDPRSIFFEEQMLHYRDLLRESEEKFEDFRQQYGVFSLDQQRSLLLNQRSALDVELKTTENRIEETAKKLASLREQQTKISENVPLSADNERFPVVDDAKSRLLALQLKEQELLAKYRDESQLVQNVREEKRVVEQFLARVQNDRATRTRTGKNPVYEQMQIEIVRTIADYDAFGAKRAAIEQQMSGINDELRTLDLRDKELQQLEREIKNNRTNYEIYLAKVEEARISEQMDQQKLVNVSIVEPATLPTQPAWPRKTLNVALAIVFGLAAGLGIAFLAEYLSSGFLTPETAGRSLGVRVLGTVPYRNA